MAESSNISFITPAGKDKGKLKIGEELAFSVTSDTNVEVFNLDLRVYKGRVSIQANNEGANPMTVTVTGSKDRTSTGTPGDSDKEYIDIPNSSEDGIVTAGSSKVFTPNPLVRYASIQVSVKRTGSPNSTTGSFWVCAEEF